MAEERRWTVFRLRNRSARQLHAHVNTDRRVVDDDLAEQALQAEREKREEWRGKAEHYLSEWRNRDGDVAEADAERDEKVAAADMWRTRAEKAEAQLAECYRLTGSDPDGDPDSMLARHAVQAVRELREENERVGELEDRAVRAEAQLATLRAEVDSSIRRIHTWLSDEATRWLSPSQQTLLSMVESCDELLDSLHKPDQQGER